MSDWMQEEGTGGGEGVLLSVDRVFVAEKERFTDMTFLVQLIVTILMTFVLIIN